MTETPKYTPKDLIDVYPKDPASSEEAFIALLGFSPEDLLLELFVAEHEHDAPRTYAWRRG